MHLAQTKALSHKANVRGANSVIRLQMTSDEVRCANIMGIDLATNSLASSIPLAFMLQTLSDLICDLIKPFAWHVLASQFKGVYCKLTTNWQLMANVGPHRFFLCFIIVLCMSQIIQTWVTFDCCDQLAVQYWRPHSDWNNRNLSLPKSWDAQKPHVYANRGGAVVEWKVIYIGV